MCLAPSIDDAHRAAIAATLKELRHELEAAELVAAEQRKNPER